jgi:hypothetical protein
VQHPLNPALPTPPPRLPLGHAVSAATAPPAPNPDQPVTRVFRPEAVASPEAALSALASAKVVQQCQCSRCAPPQGASPGFDSVSSAPGPSLGAPDGTANAVGGVLVGDFGAG